MSTTSTIFKRRSRKLERNGTASRPTSSVGLHDDLIGDLTAVFKLLADKSRLKIVLALAQQGQMHVTALCDLLHQSQPAVSHHLTLMRMVGLVGYDRNGKHNFYYLASDHLRDLLEQCFIDTSNTNQALEFDALPQIYSSRRLLIDLS